MRCAAKCGRWPDGPLWHRRSGVEQVVSLAPVDMLDALAYEWEQCRLSALEYATHGEPIARQAAASGHPGDIKRLAHVLSLKATGLREVGRHADALDPDAEALALLDELADNGDNGAMQMLQAFSGFSSVGALMLAATVRDCERPEATPRLEPEVPLMPPLPPLSMWARFRWWCTFRWDDLRWWCGDRVWDIKIRWWELTDRWRGGK